MDKQTAFNAIAEVLNAYDSLLECDPYLLDEDGQKTKDLDKAFKTLEFLKGYKDIPR